MQLGAVHHASRHFQEPQLHLLCAGLYFGREVPPDCDEAKLPLHGPNQWPPEVVTQMYSFDKLERQSSHLAPSENSMANNMFQQLKRMLSKVPACLYKLTLAVCTPSRMHTSHPHAALTPDNTSIRTQVASYPQLPQQPELLSSGEGRVGHNPPPLAPPHTSDQLPTGS